MKKIMVVYSIPAVGVDAAVRFFDHMHDADQFKWDCDGYRGRYSGCVQVYEWNENRHCYEFVYE